MNIRQYFMGLLLMGGMLGLGSCMSKPGILVPTNPIQANQLPKIYPDYIGVTVPATIAPLNFNVEDIDAESVNVVVEGSKIGELQSEGDYANFDIDEWHHLLAQNRGGDLKVTVYREGKVFEQEYKIGIPQYAVREIGTTENHGTTVTFKPDETIFTGPFNPLC